MGTPVGEDFDGLNDGSFSLRESPTLRERLRSGMRHMAALVRMSAPECDGEEGEQNGEVAGDTSEHAIDYDLGGGSGERKMAVMDAICGSEKFLTTNESGGMREKWKILGEEAACSDEEGGHVIMERAARGAIATVTVEPATRLRS